MDKGERRNKYRVIGESYPRKDGISKVTGQEKFTSDISFSDMLYAKVLRSPYPHARVKEIDASKAREEGAVCVTFKDVPKLKYNERLVSVPEATYKDKRVLTDKPLHVGEAIAAVAAPSEKLAQELLELIDVNYEKLDFVLDPHVAMSSESPKIHESVLVGDKEVKIEENVSSSLELSKGNIDEGFSEADVIVEGEFRTGRQYHAQLETKTVVCRPEPDGGITVWLTTQGIHNVRILLGQIFDIPLNKIDVKKVPPGGSFGSSIQMNSVVPICVALALKSGKTVKLASTREGDMYDHCRYPAEINLKLGAREDGTLTAGDMEVLVDNGAHNIQAYPLLGCMVGWWVSLYKLPNLKYSAKSVYTNKVPACAMQGFGNPQVNFAVESLMDEVAEKLGMDPIELRKKNYVGLGDTFWGQGPTVKSTVRSCGVEELLERGARKIGWEKRKDPKEKEGKIRKGIGMARGFHTSSAGGPLPGETIDYSSATVKINEDGSVDVITALQDMGEGTLDAGAKLVAEELAVPVEKVGLSPASTRTTTYDVNTHATRGVYAGGGAIHDAAKKAKEKLFKFASRLLEAPTDALKVKPDPESGQGVVYVEGVKEKEIPIGEVAEIAREKNWGTIAGLVNKRHVNCPPAYSAQFVEVEVNTDSGEIDLVKAVLGNDAGTVINPKLADGQLHGGFYRGASLALAEGTNYDEKTGKLKSKGKLKNYRMLTPEELPLNDDIITFYADTREPSGPFGAKGIGEATTNPTLAAIANAVYNAIGVRFKETPITPDKVKEALEESENID